MSKQLLHSFKSHVVAVALSDRAFAVVTSETDATSGAQVYELLPPAVSALAAPAKKKSKVNASDAEKDGANAENVVVQDGHKQEAETKSDTSADTKDEIQAVCSTEIDSHIWLAVSREDKTLSLYCVADCKLQDDVRQLQPVVIYNIPKRARCLVFQTIRSSKGRDCNMIIAGDLSGDAFAYPVPNYDSIDPTAVAAAKPSSRRLLLGHTASMLTGMQVAPANGGRQFLLTADRDEKVRVSCFPETYIVHGYLLGHTAFISAIDAVSGDGVRPLCLTGSGDGTVRLWDYQTCKEVGMVPVVLQPQSGDGRNNCDLNDEDLGEEAMCESDNHEVNEDESVEFDGESGDDDFDEAFYGQIAVPLAVAMSSDAKYVVVAREGISSIDIHPVPEPDASKKTSGLSSMFLSQLTSLHKKQTLPCPSQPLDVCLLSDGSVLVLAREPDYILHFKNAGTDFEDATSTSPICSALASIAKSCNISMPITALEYNEDGTLKLQKKVDNKELDGEEAEGDEKNAGNGGLHWNDKERRNTHRLANGRRRKRKLAGGKGEE